MSLSLPYIPSALLLPEPCHVPSHSCCVKDPSVPWTQMAHISAALVFPLTDVYIQPPTGPLYLTIQSGITQNIKAYLSAPRFLNFPCFYLSLKKMAPLLSYHLSQKPKATFFHFLHHTVHFSWLPSPTYSASFTLHKRTPSSQPCHASEQA